MAGPVIEAIGVSKVYAQRAGFLRQHAGTIRAVDGITCALREGETLGLVGESGCGKTTLAKLLIGLLLPNEGEVRMNGAPFMRLRGQALRAARRVVQFVFQDPTNSLNPRMTVDEIVSEPLAIHGLARGAHRRARVDELLAAVHLPADYRRRLPRELSGGERQRVGIARALATDPKALVCDEPIASLDVSVGAQILELLRTLRREHGLALLFISHDLRAVSSVCDRIAVMRHGRLVEEAPTEQLLGHPGQPYTDLLIRCASLDLDTPMVS